MTEGLERKRESLYPTRANTMAASSLLAIQCAGFDGERAGRPKKHSFADEGADRLKKQKITACPRDGRALVGDAGAKPKTRLSTKDALFIAGAYNKNHATQLVNAGKRVARLKKKLQEARDNWKVIKQSFSYLTHMNTQDAQLKIQPSKKETSAHAKVPDAEAVARLETALQQVADLQMKLLRANVAAPQIRPSTKETCAPAESINEKKTLNPAKPAIAGTAAKHIKTRTAVRIAAKGPSARSLSKLAKHVAAVEFKRENEREAKHLCGEEPFPAGLTGSRDNYRADKLASLQRQVAYLEEVRRAQKMIRSGCKSRSDGGRREPGYTALPGELIGMEPRTRDSDPICFNHNLPKGGDKAEWGGMCAKGLHICMKRRCEVINNHL